MESYHKETVAAWISTDKGIEENYMLGKINNRGSTHIIAMIVVFLLMMGAWHVYHSWEKGNLESDVKQVITTCIDIERQVVDSIKNYK